MARNQEGQRSHTQDRQQTDEVRDDRSTGRSSSEAGAAAGAASAGVGGARGSEQRGDRQRQVDVSRESGGATGMQSMGTGAQQSPSRQTGRGGAVSGRGQSQPSILPALMANPGLMTRAFMANPFAFADAMSQEMDRLFSTSELMSPSRQLGANASRGRAPTQWIPPMEVRQREDGLVVRADLPGLSPEDVNIELENGVLTISGERRDASEDRQDGYFHSERSYGAFSRSITLPEGVDEDQVNARFEHGVLEVTVPIQRQQQQRGRRVPIQSGGSRQTGQEQGSQAQGSQAQSQPQSGQTR